MSQVVVVEKPRAKRGRVKASPLAEALECLRRLEGYTITRVSAWFSILEYTVEGWRFKKDPETRNIIEEEARLEVKEVSTGLKVTYVEELRICDSVGVTKAVATTFKKEVDLDIDKQEFIKKLDRYLSKVFRS